jgi:hypothetical protein
MIIWARRGASGPLNSTFLSCLQAQAQARPNSQPEDGLAAASQRRLPAVELQQVATLHQQLAAVQKHSPHRQQQRQRRQQRQQ